MKVLLLNNGGYIGLGKVKFPVEIEARFEETRSDGVDLVSICGTDLAALPNSTWPKEDGHGTFSDYGWTFCVGADCQYIDDNLQALSKEGV